VLDVRAVRNPVGVGIELTPMLAQRLRRRDHEIGGAAKVGLQGRQGAGKATDVGVVVGAVVHQAASRHARQRIDGVRQPGYDDRAGKTQAAEVAAQ
jgi:hypothetical protein